MYEVKYRKDYRHNYLIIKENGQEKNAYPIKMITHNTIRGLLPCQERHVNGDALLFYEITSKQSIAACYEGKSIGMEMLRRFFLQLKQINELLQKYLLEESGLWLSPEYIFCNMETGEFFFLFFPQPLENNLLSLMDFFMANVDNEDMKAVETVYKIADMIRGEQFVTDEILSWFQYDYELYEQTEGSDSLQADPSENENPFLAEEALVKSTVMEQEEEPVCIDFQKAAVPGIGGMIAAAILLYVGYMYELAHTEKMLWIGGWAVAGILLLAAVFAAVFPFLKRKKKEKAPMVHDEPKRAYIKTEEAPTPQEETDMGNTVFIPWMENSENKLYSMDRKNKCHIDLGRLPLTVGKMAGAVDLVINDQSISRMHAKFSRSGNRICVSDLNSTNGTFRNGMRLDPNASEIIEPGDEIRLGKLKFIYR